MMQIRKRMAKEGIDRIVDASVGQTEATSAGWNRSEKVKPEDTKSPEYWEKHAPGLNNAGITLEKVLDDYQIEFGYPPESLNTEGGDKAEEAKVVEEEQHADEGA